MADKVLFHLDADEHYRLSFDAWQWLIHSRRPNGDWHLCAAGLRSRGEVFACLRHKDILITDEALHRIDTELMESFVGWQEARAGAEPDVTQKLDCRPKRVLSTRAGIDLRYRIQGRLVGDAPGCQRLKDHVHIEVRDGLLNVERPSR